ncbi:nose resistant to fluoxetine protein 6-like [Haemaphysalis longicornis]
MPHTRIGPFLVGMAAGYYLHISRGAISIRNHFVYIGWTMCTVLMLAVLLGMWPVDAAGGRIPVYAAALYGGFARSIWAACVAWIVIACIGGHGGFVTTLLSLKALVPLSRLTFAAYLFHTIPITIFYASRQHSFDLSASLVYYFYVGNLVLAYACALVVSVLFEAPILALEKLLLAGRM